MRRKSAGRLIIILQEAISRHFLSFFSELRLRREQYLDLLSSASSDVELVDGQFNEYLQLLHGFVFDIEQPEKSSKLRYLGKYVWSFSLLGNEG